MSGGWLVDVIRRAVRESIDAASAVEAATAPSEVIWMIS